MNTRLALFTALLLGCLSLKATGGGDKLPQSSTPNRHERFFTTFGYGVSIPKYNSLNYVIGRYNGTRPDIIKKMQGITALTGFNISAGSTNDNYILEFSYSQRGAKTQGIDSQQGYTVTRDIAVRSNLLGAGLSTKVYQTTRFKFYLGGSINFGYQNFYSRTYRSIDVEKPAMAKVGSGDLQLGISVAPQVHFLLEKTGRIRLVAKPYLFFEFLEAYYGDLNKAINPLTYVQDNNNNLYNHPWAGGIEVKLFIAF